MYVAQVVLKCSKQLQNFDVIQTVGPQQTTRSWIKPPEFKSLPTSDNNNYRL